MKRARLNHVGAVTPHVNFVIASDRRERGNPEMSHAALDCFVAALLAKTKRGGGL